jgi:polysaccharide deacetylase family protein (PEP-CTERM system associated)
VDVEEYFHAEIFADYIPRETWGSCSTRVEENTRHLLALLASDGINGTFFVLGSVAERFPELIKEIVAAGHEIASHGFEHRMITKMTQEEFREDIRKSKRILEDITGVEVKGYRAPTFSIVEKTAWAHSVLETEGFRYSSSVYPIRHDRYGWTDFGTSPRKLINGAGGGIWEIPLSTVPFGFLRIPFGGGGYLRLYPFIITKYLASSHGKSEEPLVIYVHPWELDHYRPEVELPLRKRIRHYCGIRQMEGRLKTLFRNRCFERMEDAVLRLNANALHAGVSE